MKKAILTLVLALTVISLAGCPAPTPQIIEVEKPVIVEEKVVETVEVVKEVPVEKIVRETVEVEKEVIVEKEVVVTPTPAPVEITLWTEFTAAPKVPVMDEWIAGFEAEYPWITVTHRGIANDVYDDTLQTAMLGGDPPDMFVTGMRAQIADLVDEGLIYDLTNWYRDHEDRFITGYDLNSVIRGRRYAIPWTILVLDLLWYNPSMMDQYGLDPQSIETFEDLMDTCEVLQENGEVCFAFGGGSSWTSGHWTYMLIQNNLPQEEWMQLVRREKPWTDPEVVKVLSGLEQLVEADYLAPGAASDDRDTGRALYFQGQGGFFSAGSWHLYQKGSGNAPPDWEFEFIPFPPFEEYKGLDVALSGSNIQWNVSSQSEHLDEALLFLEYISRLDNASLWVREVQEFITVRDSVNEGTAGPEMAAIAQYVEDSNVQSFLEHYLPTAVTQEGLWAGSTGILSEQIDTQEWCELIESIHELEGALPLE